VNADSWIHYWGLILILLALAHVGVVLFFRIGLGRLRERRATPQPPVSIIVPARDEEALLPRCIASLQRQQGYPPERIEIIVVDDRSEDSTAEIVRRFAARDPRVRLLQVEGNPKGYSPKKNAVDQGIAVARGEILLPIDADCEAHPGWLAAMVRAFEPDVAMVSGFAELDRPDHAEELFIRIQSLELLSLFACAAGSTTMGWILASSGACQAYRRSTWEAIGGFGEIGPLVSGDDDLMAQRVARLAPGRIVFALDPAARVLTEPMRTLRGFYEQRKRWGSKYTHHKPSYVAFLTLFYILNLLLISGPALVWLGGAAALPPLLLALLLKWGAEYALLARAATLFRRRDLLRYFPLWALLHLPYIALMGPISLFGKVVWKGRTHGSRSQLAERSRRAA
jgi:cellulose synthase/poly-beta-1,6-N-acetylglucosamine synthase-like glycosyltransferase